VRANPSSPFDLPRGRGSEYVASADGRRVFVRGRRQPRMREVIVASMLVFASACAPTFDWRESRLASSGAVVLFPCRPLTDAKSMTFEALRFDLTLHACRAGGMTFGLAHADLGDATKAAAALHVMRESWSATAGADVLDVREIRVPNARDDEVAIRVHLRLRQPDGRPAEAFAAFLARGSRVYQATVYGAPAQEEAAETFLSGLRLQ